MSKRKAAGGSGRGSSWMLLAGAVVVLALGAVAWLLLDEPSAGPVAGDPGAVVSVADSASEALPMVVPQGVESQVSAIEVEPGRPRGRIPAGAPGLSGPRRRISGRLLRFADRSPITDAQLSADGSTEVRTDPKDGSFLLAVTEGDLDLQLMLGVRRAVVKLPAATGDLEDLELVVDTGWILPGVVRGVGGEPIPGALVQGPGSSTVCDAAGRFRLLDVRPSSVSPGVKIRALAPMYESRETTVPLPAGERVTPPVSIQLRGAGALEGWVQPPAGTILEPGLPVRILLSSANRDIRVASRLLQTTAAEDGHYRIDGIPAGTFFAVVGRTRGDKRLRVLTQTLARVDVDGPKDVTPGGELGVPELWVPDVVIREGEVTRLDASLLAGGFVAGRVTDAAGNPLVGAVVEAVRVQVWTGVRGRGTLTTSSNDIRITVGEARPGEVYLTAPVSNAVTDDRGLYQLRELPPGVVQLSASHAEHPGWRATERTLQVSPGVRSTGVDLRLGEGLRVLGRVFDALGQPAAGAKVAVLEKDDPLTAAAKELSGQVANMANGIEVGDDGRFDLAGVPTGPLTLVVTLSGHQTVLRDVSPSLSEIRVDLELAAVFRGRVLDSRSGEPVTSFHVLLRGHGISMGNQLRPEDGRFAMDGLEQKEYRLEVRAMGYRRVVLIDALPSFDSVEREILLVPVN